MLCFCMNWTPATLHVSRNPFRCRTSEKSPHNSNHCHTSKTAVFKPCVCHTSEPPGGPLFQLGNLPLACQTSSSFFSYPCALFCTCKNHNFFIFKRFRALCQKPPGVGVPLLKRVSGRMPSRFQPSHLQAFSASVCCIIPRRGRSEIETLMRVPCNLWCMGES